VRVGTTTGELRAISGDSLVVPAEPDECAGLAIQLLDGDAVIVAFLNEARAVHALETGLQMGC